MQTVQRPLTRSQLRELEQELLSERARLERSMAVSAAAEGASTPDGESPAAVPGGDPEGDVEVALRSRVEARYEAIRGALERISSGAYGLCTGCQSPIPFGRLLVMPESEHCVACGPAA